MIPTVHPHTNPDRAAVSPVAWVKADLHLHTSEDPFDEIDYTALELLDKAHRLGFNVLAITLHDKVFDDPSVFARAEALGILLIQAAELRIEGADVVLLNLTPAEAAALHSFDDLRSLRARRGNSLLTFAPHPFYRLGGSIGHRLELLVDCFDAVEYCHFHVPLLDPNVPAMRLAEKHGLPVLATSDAHRRKFFGQNYSLLGVEGGGAPTISGVFEAIRAGRIQRVSPTGGWSRLAAILFFVFCVHPILVRLPGAKRAQARKRRRAAARRSLSCSHPCRRGIDLNIYPAMNTLFRRISFFLLCSGLAASGCKTTPDAEPAKKPAATVAAKPIVNKLKDQSGDVAFESFISRLRQVVAAHDVTTLASMMTTDFGYVLEPPQEGAGVFKYWDEHNLWPELQMIIKERFVPFGDDAHVYMVAPAEFAASATTYTSYRAGVQLVNGNWKFAYFVNGQ